MPMNTITLSLVNRVRQNISRRLSSSQLLLMLCRRRGLLLLVAAFGFATAAHAQTYYYVDCSGANPADFSTMLRWQWPDRIRTSL